MYRNAFHKYGVSAGLLALVALSGCRATNTHRPADVSSETSADETTSSTDSSASRNALAVDADSVEADSTKAPPAEPNSPAAPSANAALVALGLSPDFEARTSWSNIEDCSFGGSWREWEGPAPAHSNLSGLADAVTGSYSNVRVAGEAGELSIRRAKDTDRPARPRLWERVGQECKECCPDDCTQWAVCQDCYPQGAVCPSRHELPLVFHLRLGDAEYVSNEGEGLQWLDGNLVTDGFSFPTSLEGTTLSRFAPKPDVENIDRFTSYAITLYASSDGTGGEGLVSLWTEFPFEAGDPPHQSIPWFSFSFDGPVRR